MIKRVRPTDLSTGAEARGRAGPQGLFKTIGRKLQRLWGGNETDIEGQGNDAMADATDHDVPLGPDQVQAAPHDDAKRHVTRRPQASARAVPRQSNPRTTASAHLADAVIPDGIPEPGVDAETENDRDLNETHGGNESADGHPQLGLRQRRAVEEQANHEQAQRAREAALKGEEEAAAAIRGTGPLGVGEHVVDQGERIPSIAEVTGHLWETIWKHPANEALKDARKDPNILLPGDKLTVPATCVKYEPGETETRHRFRLNGDPAVLRIRLLDDDEPIPNAAYVLTVDREYEYSGDTDSTGLLCETIPVGARRGVLEVHTNAGQRVYELDLGYLDPVTEVTGVQQRLHNLGFSPGPIDGIYGPLTTAAMQRFQEARGMAETGKPDSFTIERLREDHGS